MIPIAEQIYTSAPKLLDGHSSHLGVVAQTRDLPQELNAEFANHRAYSLLPETVEGKLNPPRYVITRSRTKNQLLLSRVCYAGADHTGRTAPFAHHMAVEQSNISAAQLTFAQVTAAVADLFYQRWDQPVAWIEPARPLPKSPSPKLSGAWAALISAELQPTILASMAETMWRYGKEQRPLVVCLPKNHAEQVLEMAINLVQLLPPNCQQQMSIASHVVQQSDYLRDATLIFTYSESEFLQGCQSRQDPRRPVIVNLSAPDAPSPDKPGSYGTLLQTFWEKHGYERLVHYLPFLEKWSLAEPQYPLFAEAILIHQTLQQQIKSEQCDKLSALVAQLGKDERYQSLLLEWVSNHCQTLPANDFGTVQVIARLATDSRWPGATREQFLSLIAQNWHHWSGLIWSELKAQPQVIASLQQGLRAFANPAFVMLAFQQALKTSDPKYAEFIVPWLSSQPLAFDGLSDMLLQLGQQSLQQLPALRPVLLQQLHQAVQTESDSAKLIQLARTAPVGSDCRLLIADFYRQNLEQKSNRLPAILWADGSWQLAIDSTNPSAALQTLRGLQQVPCLHVTPAIAMRWRQMLRGTIHESACAPILDAIAATPANIPQQNDFDLEFAAFSDTAGKRMRPLGRALPTFRSITTLRLIAYFCIVLLSCAIFFEWMQEPPFGAMEFRPEILNVLLPVLCSAGAIFLIALGVTYLRPNHWSRVTHQIRRWLAYLLWVVAAIPFVWLTYQQFK